MKRREFIAGLGGAAVWPPAVRAQQSAMPVVGYLYAGSPEGSGAAQAEAFRKGLGEGGFVEGRNVSIEYRWGNGDLARLPELAAELVRRQVALIFTPSIDAALVAKASTSTIPIVFNTGSDPIQSGLVTSLNRPGANITGFATMLTAIGTKQFGLLQELLPTASRFAALVSATAPNAEEYAKQVQAAAEAKGRQLELFAPRTNSEIDVAFARMVQNRTDAVLVGPSPLFGNRGVQLTTLSLYHRLPTMFTARESVKVGGLVSYGSSNAAHTRQAGIYAARILKGEKPGDLPVQRAAKFELVLNLQTARVFGLTIPETLLATADEVIQ
jgi:putative tryptophan/tyrosine transport system substrate-binding protein